jgi:hypothetical protein
VARIIPWQGSRLEQLVAEGKVTPATDDPRGLDVANPT